MALTVSKSYYGSQSFNDVIRPFFIMEINSKLNKKNELDFVEASLGRTVKQVITTYNNIQNTSYVVPVRFEEFYYKVWTTVKKLVNRFNQESVLFVNNDRIAYLFFLNNGISAQIGKFQRIQASEAIESGNWTLDHNQFWGVK